MLSECTTFEESAVLAYQIIPKTDFKNAEKSLKLTSLARQLASTYNYPGFINMVNCDNALRRADLGSSLTLKNFLNINLILKNIRIADNFCRNIEDKIFYKDFIDLFEIIRPNKSLENKIEISNEHLNKISQNNFKNVNQKDEIEDAVISAAIDYIMDQKKMDQIASAFIEFSNNSLPDLNDYKKRLEIIKKYAILLTNLAQKEKTNG